MQWQLPMADPATISGNGGFLQQIPTVLPASVAASLQEPFNRFVVLVFAAATVAIVSLEIEASMDGGDMLLLSLCNDVNANAERVLFVAGRSTVCSACAFACASV